ncbi:YGGT family protein [Desulfitobacterium dichloroeliminans LMG P-21439]|uniref:YGGT family protein n=1 Tax=Desulfitobacterium dichloroeliminans (strain LMG P-21439 / DCA1) TaxID=871963 RepID=L0F616_DESDL|nr:YggT family protein [Desulfitobacterium dichloroeliminans]AGA69279.1 YGGT family protein [Desulfitobacterium dichloroeliminans LMG P-21439]
MNHTEEIQSIKRIVYYILGVIEVLLAFRFILKLLGANPASGFVSGIYTMTNIFLSPFTGIFRTASARGVETQAVIEPANLVAMLVYAVIAWGIVKLIEILKRPNKV